MARDHARIRLSLWGDPDFRALTADAQRVYMMAMTAPDLALTGVVPFTLRRWARAASDTTPERLRTALVELQARRYVLVDEDTEELFVRSFMRHDGCLKSPNLRKNIGRNAEAIYSPKILAAFLIELHRLRSEQQGSNPWPELTALLDRPAPAGDPFEPGPANPSVNPSGNPSGGGSNPPEETGQTGTKKGSPNPSPNPSAKGSATRATPAPTPAPSPAPAPPPVRPRDPGPPAPPPPAQAQAEGEDQLENLINELHQHRPDWDPADIRRALDHPAVRARPLDRIRRAALTVAADPDTRTPGRIPKPGPWWTQPPDRPPQPSDTPLYDARRAALPDADAGPASDPNPTWRIARQALARKDRP